MCAAELVPNEVVELKKKGTIRLFRGYLDETKASKLMKYLLDDAELPWEQSDVTVYDKTYKTPRLQCWMGDNRVNAEVYSANRTEWDPKIQKLKTKIESTLDFEFDYLLLNLYKTGAHYISYHADNEVVKNTDLVASLSLGETRKFYVREKVGKTEKYDFELHSGDLLVMDGYMQRSYKHSVPKTTKPVGKRINLTFRKA